MDLLRAFPKFSEVVEEAAEKYAPNLICNYLFDLAQKFNTFYAEHRIVDSVDSGQSTVDSEKLPKRKTENGKQDTSNFRLALTSATGQILKNGLGLLGIKAPQKM